MQGFATAAAGAAATRASLRQALPQIRDGDPRAADGRLHRDTGAVTHLGGYSWRRLSAWITTFVAASATVTIASGGKTLLTKTVTLTPGPLVIALRPDNVPVGHNWPPTATSLRRSRPATCRRRAARPSGSST